MNNTQCKLEQIEIIPTQERIQKEDMMFSLGYFKSKDNFLIVSLYHTGKLGSYPKSLDRLRAGLMLVKDYYYSIFSTKITADYNGLNGIHGGRGADNQGISRHDAAERYLHALKAVGKYEKYLLHFLRDEKNVRSFIQENPILNQESEMTYRAVYRGIREMLDLLAAYYNRS